MRHPVGVVMIALAVVVLGLFALQRLNIDLLPHIIYPDIRVRIVDSPSLNAFALPNGSIYINTGMLTRLDNEAQLATVLAHEGVHFTHKHSWQQRRKHRMRSTLACRCHCPPIWPRWRR